MAKGSSQTGETVPPDSSSFANNGVSYDALQGDPQNLSFPLLLLQLTHSTNRLAKGASLVFGGANIYCEAVPLSLNHSHDYLYLKLKLRQVW